jgi:prepilin peptidase CpaA
MMVNAVNRLEPPGNLARTRTRIAGVDAWDAACAASVAAGVVACFFWSAREEPLLAFGWAAAFLFLVIQQDVSRMRIPNWITLPALCLALLGALVGQGSSGFGFALAGAGTALAVSFVPFAVRWLGAGDVKALMVLGALWGGGSFLGAFWWMVVVGGLLAICLIAVRGGFGDLLRRWLRSARVSIGSGRITYFAADADSPARSGLPFAVAMGLGASAFQAWGTPW